MRAFVHLLIALAVSIQIGATPTFNQTKVDYITKQNGLPNNTVSAIYQDSLGFIWLGTDVGLTRHDGLYCQNYAYIGAEPYMITAIYETDNRWLLGWAENRRELICFDKDAAKYIPISSKSHRLPEKKDDIFTMAGHIYCLLDNTLHKLSLAPQGDSIQINATTLPNDTQILRTFRGMEGGTPVFATADAFILCNPDGKLMNKFDYSIFHMTDANQVSNAVYFNQHLWLFCRNSTSYCYNIETKDILTFTLESSLPILLQLDATTFAVANRNKLLSVQFGSENYAKSGYQATDLFRQTGASSGGNHINAIHYDEKNEVLWVSVNGQGLIKIVSRDSRINTINLPDELMVPKQILQDIDGYIWVATEGNGIYKSTHNEISPRMKFVHWTKSQSKGNYCMYQDPMKNIWFGNNTGEIFSYSPHTDELEHITINEEYKISGIKKLFLNSRGRLWVAAQEGLLVYDTRTEEVLAFKPNDEDWGSVTAICEDGGGVMWIGTEKGIRKAVRTDAVIELTAGYEDSTELTSNEVLTLYQNKYNQLFASYLDKVIQIDGKEKNVNEAMVLHKNFSSGRIRCIVDDQSGNTWLGTNSGIIVVNNETLESYLYEQTESYRDVCTLNDGNLLWLNEKGLIYFNPLYVKEWISDRDIIITNLEVNLSKAEVGKKINNEIVLDKAIHLTDRLQLNYRNNSLRIYVSDLTYSAAPTKLEYRLLPLNTEWSYTYDSNVRLNNLPSGSYTLELQSPCLLNKENAITRLAITIEPFWATTWWAWCLYLLGTAGLAMIFYLYFRRVAYNKYKIHMLNSKLENMKTVNETKEKYARLRGQLYVSLVQKLRSPISLLIVPLKELTSSPELAAPAKMKLKIAYRNAQTLQDFFMRLEHAYHMEDNHEYRIAPYTATRIANGIVRATYELLNASSINLHYDKDLQVNAEIWVDKQRIRFVLQSILSNMLRQMNYSGDLWLSIRTENEEKEYCVFSIKGESNSPKSEEAARQMFVRENFLAWDIIQEINRTHNGEFKIIKQEQNEQEIELWIPLGKEYWDAKENVIFISDEEITEDEMLPESTEENTETVAAVDESEALASIEVIPDSKLKLLVIEDNFDIRSYMKIIFSNLYQVYLAENGQEGVEIARRELPNLILTDVMMPVMDGFECLRILKEDFRTCHIPVIILTALTSNEDIVKGTDLGADDYILKPFNPAVLRAKVKRLMRSRVELKQIYTKLLTTTTPAATEEENTDNAVENKTEDPLIVKIVELVNANLQNPDFNVKNLADMLYMSQPTLYRKVKQITGYTIIEIVRSVRLKEAAELLKTKKYSIQEVSEMVGYNDVPTFRKHFVALYGTTPSNFAD